MIKRVHGIYETDFVSFPRSGHHAVVRALKTYFSSRLKYREGYNQHRLADTNLMKDHDFSLKKEQGGRRQYLVLHRNPQEAIMSWFLQERRTAPNVQWDFFARDKVRFWSHWYVKWVVQKVPHRKCFTYEELMHDPVGVLTRIIMFLTQSVPEDRKVLEASTELQSHTVNHHWKQKEWDTIWT